MLFSETQNINFRQQNIMFASVGIQIEIMRYWTSMMIVIIFDLKASLLSSEEIINIENVLYKQKPPFGAT